MIKVRLRRMGNRNRALYRVVVSDARRVPTSAALEDLGFYDPSTDPARVQIDRERLSQWVDRGAQLSPTVRKLLQHA